MQKKFELNFENKKKNNNNKKVKRDVVERARSVESILYQYNRFVKKSYDEYVKPVKTF